MSHLVELLNKLREILVSVVVSGCVRCSVTRIKNVVLVKITSCVAKLTFPGNGRLFKLH